jgi:hypothetical protein
VHWDGRDRTGSPIASGMYFLEIEVTSGTLADKKLKVR